MLAATVVMPLGAQNQEITPPAPTIPEGFTAIFNGKDLTGWHVSKTNHHGTTPDYRVMHGMIVGTQSPFGRVDCHPDSRRQSMGARRLLALADDCGEGTALTRHRE